MTSHESCLHTYIPTEKLRHDPDKVFLAAYHPDTKEMRHDYAQYYDKIEDMDAQAGQLLKELEESGLAENTIVFYYGDNGGVLARSKRYVYESGTQIPLIIRIPEKYKYLYPVSEPGQKVDRLVSFIDMAPTILSITGAPIPAYMHSSSCPFDELALAQNKATLGGKKDIKTMIRYLKSDHSGVRYWGITGLLILKEEAKSVIPKVKKLDQDKSAAVRTLAAETLHGLGENDAAWKIYVSILEDTAAFDMTDRNFALNSIDAINDKCPEIINTVTKL
jgi:hypothetical protein